jgi:hypothetical protein
MKALVRFVVQPYSCDIYVRQWAWVEAITNKYLHKLLCNHHFNWIASFVCFTSLLWRILWSRIGRNNCTNNDLSTLSNTLENHVDCGQFKVKLLFPLSSFFDSLMRIVMFATNFKSMLQTMLILEEYIYIVWWVTLMIQIL